MLDILDVPAEFRPTFPFPYPGHQRGPMIEEFAHNYLVEHAGEIELEADWTYVPVHWTSYWLRRPRVRDWRRLFGHPWDRRLQAFLRCSLRPDRRYFTVSQHDDGIGQRGRFSPPLPILEFSAGGAGDIPIPLLCDPHERVDCPRDIRASFLGLLKDTPEPYPCRERMVQALAGRPEYLIRHVGNDWGATDADRLKPKTRDFVETLCRSVFALCPRGYGKTSFRMYEAMQLGCIPVYIYDEPWLPYTDQLDWIQFAVLVPLSEADRLHEILSSHTSADIQRMQERIQEVYPRFFTFGATVREMLRYVAQVRSTALDVERHTALSA